MERDLKNSVVVITGGAAGIGYEIADKFLERGAKVIILLDIAEEQGLNAAKNLCSKYGDTRAVFIKCDVTKDLDEVFDSIVEKYKTVNVLVNNAGIANEQLYKKTIDINVKAVIDGSLKFWEHMRTDKGGKGGTIINISSMFGVRIFPYIPVYHASKFAVMAFSKSLGHTYNFDRSGIRVICICPGFTETNIIGELKTSEESVYKDFAEFVKKELWQKVDAVGKAAVEVFENANSGTAWLIEGAKPIVEV